MGSYLTASELGRYFPEARIIDLADGDDTETLIAPAAGTLARLEERIANAEAEADSYLQGRFALPISPAPERLKLAVGKIALFYLFEDKPEQFGSGPNPMQKQYDIHREWLEGVKEEEMYIGSVSVVGATDEAYSTAEDAGGAGLVFGGGGLSDY